VAKAMAVYLDFEKVEPRQLEDARLAIELFCAERVAARISEDEVAEIRAYLAVEDAQVSSGEAQSLHDFHVLVARLTTNPALHLFVQTLTDLTQRQPALERNRLSLDDVHAAHAKIAEAIIARDDALARHRMMTHLEEVSATGSRRPPARSASRSASRGDSRGDSRGASRSEERSAARGVAAKAAVEPLVG